jgi:hypothetical protein
MIGFNTFSSPSGLACFAASAQYQVEGMSTEWQSPPNGPDTTSSARPAISRRDNLAVVSQVSDGSGTHATTDHRFDHIELKQAKQAVKSGGARHAESDRKAIHDIYRYVLRSGSWTKSTPVTVK